MKSGKLAEFLGPWGCQSVLLKLSAAALLSSLTANTVLAQTIDKLTVPLAAPVATLDPIIDVSASTQIFYEMTKALTYASGASDEVKPFLAKSWDTSDNITWTFHLDPLAKWQDGTPVTADDVVFTVQTEEQPSNPHAASFRNVASVTAADPHTVVFVLKSPTAAWSVQLGIVFIVPKDYYQKVGPQGFAAKPIGSGPYRFVSSSGGGVVLEAWPDYYGAKPAVKQLVYKPVTSPQAQLAGLESGDLDVVADVPPSQVARFKAMKNVSIKSGPSNNSIFMAYNVAKAPLSNADFRQAVGYAIDRKIIADKLFLGFAQPLGGPVPKNVFGYAGGLAPTAFDLAKAKELLKKSGYDGSEIPLTYPTSAMPQADPLGQIVASYLTAAGINVKLVPLDYATFIQKWAAKQIDGMYLFQYRNGGDAEFLVTSLFADNSRAYFNDPAVSDLVAKERGAVGRDNRLSALVALWNDAVATKAYYTILLAPDVIYGVSNKVPFIANPNGLITFDAP